MTRNWSEAVSLANLTRNEHVWNELIAWTKGYILALEDTIKDVETLLQAMQYGYGADARTALEAVLEKVQDTLATAKETESVILKLAMESKEAE